MGSKGKNKEQASFVEQSLWEGTNHVRTIPFADFQLNYVVSQTKYSSESGIEGYCFKPIMYKSPNFSRLMSVIYPSLVTKGVIYDEQNLRISSIIFLLLIPLQLFGFYVHVIDLYNSVQSRWATAYDHLQTI